MVESAQKQERLSQGGKRDMKAEYEQRCHELAQEVLLEMRSWREEHPTATLQEIEEEVDRRIARWRAGLVEGLLSLTLFDKRRNGRKKEIVQKSRRTLKLKEDDLDEYLEPSMYSVAATRQGIFHALAWTPKQDLGAVCLRRDQSQ
jgi:hypothetical protein